MKRVAIVQRRLTHYRVPLFNALRQDLTKNGIHLDVYYGDPDSSEMNKSDSGRLEWGIHLPSKYFFNNRICLQSTYQLVKSYDLIVLTQENRLVSNLAHLFFPSRKCKVAFWGHGANLQSVRPHGFREQFKRWVSGRVDWWFAYTDVSQKIIADFGFPPEKITVLNNSIDTKSMAKSIELVAESERVDVRKAMGLAAGPVAVFIGSLYKEKRLDFLMAAATEIKKAKPDFNLFIIGDGPLRDEVVRFSEMNPWVKWLGIKNGHEKVVLLSLCSVMLNPGAVGLNILDSFVCRIPILTTDCGTHGPEIAYLKHAYNGIVVENDLDKYVSSCLNVIRSDELLDSLRNGCKASSRHYSIENMVSSFSGGIELALISNKSS